MSYMDRASAGDVVDIDDCIDEWHAAETKLTLWAWLGMTKAEYRRFAEKPSALSSIVEARRAAAKRRRFFTSIDIDFVCMLSAFVLLVLACKDGKPASDLYTQLLVWVVIFRLGSIKHELNEAPKAER